MGENTKIEWADHTFNPWAETPMNNTELAQALRNAARFVELLPEQIRIHAEVHGGDGDLFYLEFSPLPFSEPYCNLRFYGGQEVEFQPARKWGPSFPRFEFSESSTAIPAPILDKLREMYPADAEGDGA
jgi:hypothetical protein